MTTTNLSPTGMPAAEPAASEGRGWFAHMIQLWLEHNARLLEMGGEPF
ncbi:hypothetical protein [Methylobacterium sp. J-090]|nr:hypothetical protein [Methylobacterium sp. J-090]MCJ2081126.1 hypothetical protein [Methylobacterium sp. J-090]